MESNNTVDDVNARTTTVSLPNLLCHSTTSYDIKVHNASPAHSLALPTELTFNDDNLVSVIANICLFVIAASGNLTVFITLCRSRSFKSRVNTFIMHLSVADLIVAFIMLPLETVWHATVSWNAGDFLCRLMMFCRAFGFYLSSFILMAISLDRYFSIVHPMSLHDADRRGRIMLGVAWTLSVIASLPQSVIFHVEQHPVHKWFHQCVTFNFFPTPTHELAYNLFSVMTVYMLPLIVITTSYTLILCKISQKARSNGKGLLVDEPRHHLTSSRCHSSVNIEKAKLRTLKMTFMIVSVFIFCWTPYYIMAAYWWFDRDAAVHVHQKLQRGLFLFAVSSACMDPLVYGMFTTTFRREAKRWRVWFKWRLGRQVDPPTNRVMHRTRENYV